MPRKRIDPPEEAEAAVDIRLKRRGRPPKVETDDPREAMSTGAIVEVPKGARRMEEVQRSRAGSDIFSTYARNLIANNGDPIPALAATFNVSEEVARERAQELHDEVRSYSRSGLALSEMLERHDLSREVRLAVLRQCLFTPVPAVQLKAVEMLEEVDMTAKAARIGTSWEDIVRMARERAVKPKRK